MISRFRKFDDERGQSLVEYLLILALMGVATIGVMRILSQSISVRFARVTHAIQGTQQKLETPSIEKNHIKKKDMSDFFNGVATQ